MLKIAAVGNNYGEIKRFVEHKFKDKIEEIRNMQGTYKLKNGDIIELCYEEKNKNRYLSAEYDAIVIDPLYYSLLDVIKHRTERS